MAQIAQDRATDILREDHESIRRVVASMAVLLIKLESGKEVKPETLQSAAQFMKLAGDVHEKKEEDFLFPILERRGVPTSIAPIGILVRNHHKARELVSRLGTTADSNAAGWLPLESPLLESLQGLADIYPLHLWQEDMLLYRIAEQSLTAEDDQDLLESFRRLDESAGGDVRHRFRELADEVERGTW